MSRDAAKLSPCEEMVTCDAIIGAAINRARRVKMAVNVDTNGGNLNIPALEESELAATMAELEITLETREGLHCKPGR